MANEALKLPEVALRLNCSIKTVRRLVATGQLRAFRIGRSWRVENADVLTYIAGAKTAIPFQRTERRPATWIPGRR